MATIKRITDLTEYANILPYASEMFGVYQPLLGWKSKRMEERFQEGFKRDRASIFEKFRDRFIGSAGINYAESGKIGIELNTASLQAGKARKFDSALLHLISKKVPEYASYNPSIWRKLITEEAINKLLAKDVVQAYSEAYRDFLTTDGIPFNAAVLSRVKPESQELLRYKLGAFERQLQYESSVGGMLLYLAKHQQFDSLRDIFYDGFNKESEGERLLQMLSSDDAAEAFFSLEHMDPQEKEHIQSIALSPISVVHLFRQYFFELDTFLGPPVSHVWLSPGSSVELIEIHTRSTTVERSLETTLDILTRSEKTTVTEDEISDAVRENNQQDISFGASVSASYASIEATSSFDYINSQQMARETTHRRLRQQTERLSSQIRKNFKTTFRTITETTDISSTKHTLANTTQELLNYELRRKMRQVGVQVQDIGTFLCWQAYVDDPGRSLGVAKLVHIAKPVDMEGIPHPEEIPLLQNFQEEKMITIPFISVDGTNADNENEVYKDGVEVDNSEWFGSLEKIQADFKQEFVCPKSDYELANIEFDPQGKPVSVSRKGAIINSNSKATFTLHLDSVDFQGQNSIQIKVILHWAPLPAANEAITIKNKENLENFKEREKAEAERAYVEAVKERVEMASKITSRKSEELREEERIVVYRQLIQGLLLNGVDLPDDKTRHVVSEVINSIFDVEKMLYFVAPEWWRPRLHRSRQQLQETPDPPPATGPAAINVADMETVMRMGLYSRFKTVQTNLAPSLLSASTVGWGGADDINRDNYFITDESEPARLGSSLGWLLQLDGDNMRNAFLNAPWVKAVIPIRPGKEEAAINWLKGVEGMNGITDDVIYHASHTDEKDINGNPLDGQKLIDVLMDLAKKVKKKYREGIEAGQYPKQDEVADPALVDEENTVTATPIDRVYEHGFFPLEGSFRANVGKNFEIFDQWVEILPTDQIVPVEVRYDPKTGRQI